MSSLNKDKPIALYQNLLSAWNTQDARGMAELFADDGVSIGYDGSISNGRTEIFEHLSPIFQHHRTAQFVSRIKSIQFLTQDIAILRAIAGMVPPDGADINPNVNTHHTLVTQAIDGQWKIKLFQNTPAQFHGRPELAEQMSAELRELLQ